MTYTPMFNLATDRLLLNTVSVIYFRHDYSRAQHYYLLSSKRLFGDSRFKILII